MALYRLKDSTYWWVSLVCPRTKQRIRCSSRLTDKAKAKLFEEDLRASLVLGENHYALQKAENGRTWKLAAQRWLKETQSSKSHEQNIARVEWLNTYLGDKALKDIDAVLIHRVTEILLSNLAPATTNRYLVVISSILHKAYKQWGWLDKIPHIHFKKEPSRRIRYLTLEEAKRLLGELPKHLQSMALFSLNTGLRASNVTGLTWNQVDLKRAHILIYADQAKAGKALAVPINTAALHILMGLVGVNDTYVFTFKGQPVTRPNNHAWRKALTRAGIGDFRWHDLRHTWATWHIQAGTPLHVLQELGGWSSYEMVRRYAHLTSDHLKSYSQLVSLGDVIPT